MHEIEINESKYWKDSSYLRISFFSSFSRHIFVYAHCMCVINNEFGLTFFTMIVLFLFVVIKFFEDAKSKDLDQKPKKFTKYKNRPKNEPFSL